MEIGANFPFASTAGDVFGLGKLKKAPKPVDYDGAAANVRLSPSPSSSYPFSSRSLLFLSHSVVSDPLVRRLESRDATRLKVREVREMVAVDKSLTWWLLLLLQWTLASS